MPSIIHNTASPPILTVAIPAYNHAPFIEQAILSTLSQGIQNLEVIVVDDASTDGTAEVAERIARKDHRVRVHRNKNNLGPSGTTHRYLDLAQGKYICTLPSDDAFLPGKLKKQIDLLESKPNTAIVGTGVSFINEYGQPISQNRHFASSFRDVRHRSRPEWLRYFFNVGNCICASSVMARTDIFRRFKPDLRLLQLQDYDSWVRIAIAGYDIDQIDEPLTVYRIRKNNGNLSAPTAETFARNLFEVSHVLSHFRSMETLRELQAMLPLESNKQIAKNEAAYVQHRLSLHAWHLGRNHHRMFALENWFRLLGDSQIIEDLERWGLTPGFLAEKSSHYPLAFAEERSLKGQARKYAARLLPWTVQNFLARRIKNSYEMDFLGATE